MADDEEQQTEEDEAFEDGYKTALKDVKKAIRDVETEEVVEEE